ncbi:MAG: sigma-70 family RNA polymerase sigma factor [Ilumatobacteraceae bacterium]
MAPAPGHQNDDTLTVLVAAALDGDQSAWTALVQRLERVVWKSVNMMSFDAEIRNDAFAATWLRLAERLHTIREPEKLPGWLATTATNEVRQIVRKRGPQHVSLSESWGSPNGSMSDLVDTLSDDDGEHSRDLVAGEQRREVRDAFARLDENCRQIITVLVLADPPVPYDEASDQLDRPIGSLGPIRRRCLDKLRRLLDPHTDPTLTGGAP